MSQVGYDCGYFSVSLLVWLNYTYYNYEAIRNCFMIKLNSKIEKTLILVFIGVCRIMSCIIHCVAEKNA